MTTPSNNAILSGVAPVASHLEVDLILDEDDRWREPADVEQRVQEAANAVAAWPGLLRSPSSVSVALSTDAAVMALNSQFRSKPKPTNVLSFPAGRGAPAGFLGDIILAEETVLAEAAQQDIQLAHHVQHLVVHGILHLLGYDHESPADAERMEALEIQILATLDIANPYLGELVATSKE